MKDIINNVPGSRFALLKNTLGIIRWTEEVFKKYDAEVERTKTLLLARHHMAGKVLGCYSLIEHFIRIEAKKAGLSEKEYRTKMKAQSKEGDMIFYEALNNVREIRNEIAHNFNCEIETMDTQKLDLFLKHIREEKEEVIAKIEAFTDFCILIFSFYIEDINALKKRLAN